MLLETQDSTGSKVTTLPNENGALNFFEKGCTLGCGESCYKAALQYGKGAGAPKNHTKSLELIKFSCKKNYKKACSMVEKSK